MMQIYFNKQAPCLLIVKQGPFILTHTGSIYIAKKQVPFRLAKNKFF